MGSFKHGEQTTATFIASDKSWLESEALRQLENTSKLEGMKLAMGLPDLHPEYLLSAPFVSKSWIYLYPLGNDIGCGIGFWKTDLNVQKIKIDK